MNTKRQLKKLEDTLDNIRSIARVFEHTAAQKMDVNRNEMNNLILHLREAQESYSNTKVALANSKRKKANQIMRTPMRVPVKRKIVVLVATESKYFGSIMSSIVSLFISEMRAGGADGMVVGKIGLEMLSRQGYPARSLAFFDFNDDKPNWSLIPQIEKLLTQYVEIVIFYGKYKSILTQEVQREDIGKNVTVGVVARPKKYTFEDKNYDSLAELEKHIIVSSFMQKLYETGLAKNAVAVKILQIGAIADRINVAFGLLAKWKLRVTKDSNNRKQSQLYGSRSLWEKGGIFNLK